MTLIYLLMALCVLYLLKATLTPLIREARRAYRRRQPCPVGADHAATVCGVCLQRWSR